MRQPRDLLHTRTFAAKHAMARGSLRTQPTPAEKRQMDDNSLKFLEIGAGAERRALAIRAREGAAPGLFWLSGYKSDMKGTKAAALAQWAEQAGRACVRFDYSGHGESGGAFTDGTIGRWLADSLAVFDACCRGPQILVGSSMGGWLALLMIRALRARGQNAPATVAGMVLIAPAVDFTEELMWKRFSPDIKRELEEKGVWARPSAYAPEPYLVTRQLIEEGRNHLILGNMIETGCPVRILQGVEDPDVPWRHAVELVSRLASDDVVLTLVKDGDHRLSRPEDIERLLAAVAEF
jgi:pimeloyl-ACP methyl ester carboxylesterase